MEADALGHNVFFIGASVECSPSGVRGMRAQMDTEEIARISAVAVCVGDSLNFNRFCALRKNAFLHMPNQSAKRRVQVGPNH